MTPEQEAEWHETNCQACGRHNPVKHAVCCAECGHSWRWLWLLSRDDLRSCWNVSGCAGPWDICPPWWLRVTALRLLRPSKVRVCPCCSHDL